MVTATNQDVGILVVDEEPMVLHLYTAIFQRQGYHVFTASNKQAAEHLYRKYAAEIDLVITDLQLRGETDGLTLAEQLKKIAPALPIVGVTEYVPDHQRCQALKYLDELVGKPFEVQKLQHLVANTLRKAGSAF